MEFVPSQFGTVALATFERTACSPAPPRPPWSGVQIAAPQRILVGPREKPRVPVCGYFMVPVLAAMDGPALNVYLRRTDTQAVVQGTVREEGGNEPVEPPPEDAPKASRESLAGVSTGGYFNIDAQRYLAETLATGTYELLMTYAGSKSNVLRIEIATP